MSLLDTHERLGRQRLYNNETFSDVTIHYDGNAIRAHKAILSISSDFFHKAFTGDFKESTTKDFHLFEDDAEAITGLLRFIYGFDVSQDDGSALFQLQLLIVADKYSVQSLSTSAKAALAQRLSSLAFPWADFYPSLLEDIYAAPVCDEDIRKEAIAVCQRDLEGWLGQEDFQKLLLERSELSVDILRAVAGQIKEI